jgi:cell division protease FtsH
VEYGMSDSLGPINLGAERVNVFLGEEIVKSDEHSEELSAQVDKEIIKLLRQAYGRAKDLLARNRKALDRLAKELLQREVLEGDEIDSVLRDVALEPAT